MPAFRTLVAVLRFSEVTTLLSSGNAVFSPPLTAPAAFSTRIGAPRRQEPGAAVPVIVVTGDGVSRAVASNPSEPPDVSGLLATLQSPREGADLRCHQ
jgi:uncharacterized protein (DUF1697 family)